MTNSCINCDSDSPKYKCSICYGTYCSPACWKMHKARGNCKRTEVAETMSSNVEERFHLTEDTIPLEKLHLLGSDNGMKTLLSDPFLQKLLIAVDNSPNPYECIQRAMQDPLFVKFVDTCINVVET